MFPAKPILIFVMLAFGAMVAPAQPGAASLPSLFNDDASKKNTNKCEVTLSGRRGAWLLYLSE